MTKTVKKPSLNSRVGKYFLNRQKGLDKKKSAILAGYNPTHTTRIEETDGYKRLSIKEEILKQTTLEALSKKLIDNALQIEERNASNKALEIAFDRIEPENKETEDVEKVMVILRG